MGLVLVRATRVPPLIVRNSCEILSTWALFHNRERNFSQALSRPLMASDALLRRRRIKVLIRFHNLVMAPRAVAMESLLIIERNDLRADFKFDLRNLRQQLRFGIGACMTVATESADGVRIFRHKFSTQSRRPTCRPHRF